MSTAPASASDRPTEDGHAFRSGRHAARGASGPQAQLDNLARAGVVTHVVGHGEAIDPLFAVGQLRDLPEVRFVAAFREGVIALGCPDGLPAALADLAAPISVPSDPVEAETAPPPDLQPQLDRILDRLAALEGPSGLGAVQEKLGMLDTVSLETARLVGDLAHQAAEAAQAPEAEDRGAPVIEAVEAIRADQGAFADRVTAALGDVSDRLRTVEGQIDAACEEAAQPAPPPARENADLSPLFKALPELDAGMGRIESLLSTALQQGHSRLDDVLSVIAQTPDADPAAEDQSAALAAIHSTMDDMRKQLDARDDTRRLEEQATAISALQGKLDEVQDLLSSGPEAAHSAEIAAALAALQEGTAERTSVLAALSQLHESVESLSARPDPVLDLSAQRQSFAQFGTVMKMVVQRLEGTADQIRETLETLNSRVGDIGAAAGTPSEDMPMAVAAHLRGSAEVASGLSLMAEIKEQLAQLPVTQDHMTRMAETLETLANRPKPVLDLSEQRRSFASFTTALATVVQRLENSADRFGALPDPVTAEPALTEIIEHLPEQLASRLPPALDVEAMARELAAALPPPPSLDPVLTELQALQQQINVPAVPAQVDLEPLTGQIADLAKVQADVSPVLKALTDEISALAERPSPSLDTTEQRTSFAMFSTALAAVVARLERAAAQLNGANPDSAEIAVLLNSLHETIASLSPGTADLEARLAPLTALPRQMAEMQASLEAQIAEQHLPEIDLTAQRQSLARFGTALQNVIERLETVAESLPEQVGARDTAQHRPLLKKLRRLERQLVEMRNLQEDASGSFARFLEIMAADDGPVANAEGQGPQGRIAPEFPQPRPEPDPSEGRGTEPSPPDLTAAAAPLDSLRYCFAEMIAAQIKGSAHDTPAATG